MEQIAIFASGSGTNAQRIIEYFCGSGRIHVALVLSNKADAYVVERARNLNVPSVVFSRTEFYDTDKILHLLQEKKISFLVLAGFLWLVPDHLLKAFPNRILNIHPALLPKYGGKGMYGKKVHEAVIRSGDKESGISIHWVNEKYDEGQIICQAKCQVDEGETPDSLASKIHALEYEYYPRVIEDVIAGSQQSAVSSRQ
jgi:phosphoribosylglycinamide formyltransferase 1